MKIRAEIVYEFDMEKLADLLSKDNTEEQNEKIMVSAVKGDIEDVLDLKSEEVLKNYSITVKRI